jgi:hypothetical protein
VRKNLRHFQRVSLYKGWIPSRFDDVRGRRFSFLHIDVDLYEPTLDSMTFFYPRINRGGIVVCDDYGFNTCPGVTKAIDEFLRDKPEKMVSLPDGGGFLLKGCVTSPERTPFGDLQSAMGSGCLSREVPLSGEGDDGSGLWRAR